MVHGYRRFGRQHPLPLSEVYIAMWEMGMLWDVNPRVPRELVYPTRAI